MLLGWIDFSWFALTLAYVSADAPTFVFSVNADVTAIVDAGMRVRLTQTTDKFFIVTAVGAYAAGVTPITVYGGTDYVLANAAISAGAFSTHKKPFGFNASPAKWTVELRNTTDWSAASPSSGTWYNPGSLSISIPIGAWRTRYAVAAESNVGSAGSIFVTLSTANNSESDADLTSLFDNFAAGGEIVTLAKEKALLLAAKTSYFVNAKTSRAGSSELDFLGSTKHPTIVRAECAYL